jgi:hypothetical protein
MKKIFIVIYVLGLLLLCTLNTPVKYYQFYDRYIVIHTHIFSDKGKILAGQFLLYIVVWTVSVYLTYLLLQFVKRQA